MTMRNLILLLILSVCAGCSGGGGADGPGGAPRIVTEWYDAPANTQKKAEGPVVGTASGGLLRHGAWTEYFPAADGGGRQWSRTYVDGVWAQDLPWTEFNADGSWRVDSSDR
jgi:hypothetical protein